MLVGDGVDAISFIFKYILQAVSGTFSDNIVLSINAIRCMFVNFGDNTWNLAASLYWFIDSMVDPAEWLNPTLTTIYEHVCTCQEDAY